MAYRLTPWTHVARPHSDITGGSLDMGTYAVNLARVFRGGEGVPEVYATPDRFFAATYFTERLRELLTDVFTGLAGGRGDRVLQLRTPFGGGKTHSLVALLHLARAGASGVLELADLPDPGRVRVAVLSGEELDPVRPTVTVGDVETHTLWGELGAQLGRFDLVAEHDRLHSAPGGATLRELLAGEPVLLLLDEVLTYVEKGMAVPQGESTLGRQAMLFMQALTETVNSLPGTVMVYSLQASVGEAMGSEGLLAQLDHLVSRVDAKREPVSGDEVMRVVQRRLFADLGSESVQREVARAYADLVRRQLQADAETNDARREAEREAARLETRVLTAYPFHPALLDLMYHRWGSLPSYQRTRGALQFLACVIHDLWQRGDDSALIGPGEVSLADPSTRGAFFTQVGERERYQSVLDADITSDGAGAAVVDRRVGFDSPALAQLRVGTRMATAVMLYSFGSREGEDRGVLESDLVTATVVPGIDRNVIVASLHDLREEQLFLHYTGRRYRYEPTYNLTKLVRDETVKLLPEEVLAAVREELERHLQGERGALVWPAGEAGVRDRVPHFQFVYLHPDWNSADLPLARLLEDAGASKRAYRNGVGFVLPDAAQFDRTRSAARVRLACDGLLRRRSQMRFSDEQQEELREKAGAARRELQGAISHAYSRAVVPVEGTDKAPYVWDEADLRPLLAAGRTLHQRVLEALAHRVFATVNVDRLIDRTSLGRERRFVLASDLVDWFYTYFAFPKLVDRGAIQQAVAAGVMDGKLGYVIGAEVRDGELSVRDPKLVRRRQLTPPAEIELSADAAVLTDELAAELAGAVPEAVPPVPLPVPPPPPSNGGEKMSGEKPPEVAHHLNLRARFGGDALHGLQRALSSLREKSTSMDIELTVRAHSRPEGYDKVGLRNGVLEPLTESGVEDIQVDLT
jgi:hypothetical protein